MQELTAQGEKKKKNIQQQKKKRDRTGTHLTQQSVVYRTARGDHNSKYKVGRGIFFHLKIKNLYKKKKKGTELDPN
jgi:hypothetical protein